MRKWSVQPSRESLILLFQRCGIRLSEGASALFWKFHRTLHANRELDLTRIRSFEAMVLKHYVDCAMVPGLVELPSPLLDIGSGAGFPGIPIKILRPELKLILAEGRGRRAAFLEDTCRLLGLEGVEVYPHKVTAHFPYPVQGVITRAFEKMGDTLERIVGFLPEGGQAIFMKGPRCEEELSEAVSRHRASFHLEKDIPYTIPGTPHKRRIVVFRKIPGSAHRSLPGRFDTPAGPTGFERGGSMQLKEIVSPNNPVFKTFLKLLGARGIKKHNLALLSGLKQVSEVLRDFPGRCEGLILTGKQTLPHGVVPPENLIYRLSQELFRELDIFETGQPILLVRVDRLPAWEAEAPAEGCTLCIPFQDPANVGAVIRTAAAFGVDRIVLLQEAAHPFHPKSMRAAGSALFRTVLLEGPSISALSSLPRNLITLSPYGQDIRGFRFPPSFCLVPGLEGPGLPLSLGEAHSLAIAMAPGVESLNAALATGIALYEWRRGEGTEGRWKAGKQESWKA
jgi:16S rRNA (guanine527-N7)-methyltransferase